MTKSSYVSSAIENAIKKLTFGERASKVNFDGHLQPKPVYELLLLRADNR